MRFKIMAPTPTRPTTMVRGGISATATLINKKEGPHNAARNNNHKKFLNAICFKL
jgi:hypothetical protein